MTNSNALNLDMDMQALGIESLQAVLKQLENAHVIAS